MLILTDTDPDLLLRTRRLLYAAGISTLALSYADLLTVKIDDTIDGVLVTDPYDPTVPQDFCFLFRRRHPQIPILLLTHPFKDGTETLTNADCRLDAGLPAAKLIEELLLQLSRFHGRDTALFRLGRAYDHLMDPTPTFDGISIHLTPIERSIYRHLIKAAYHPVSAKELQRYCTKPGTVPTIGNIASHIYRINFKAQSAVGYHIILSDSGGYRLLTEEEMHARTI